MESVFDFESEIFGAKSWSQVVTNSLPCPLHSFRTILNDEREEWMRRQAKNKKCLRMINALVAWMENCSVPLHISWAPCHPVEPLGSTDCLESLSSDFSRQLVNAGASKWLFLTRPAACMSMHTFHVEIQTTSGIAQCLTSLLSAMAWHSSTQSYKRSPTRLPPSRRKIIKTDNGGPNTHYQNRFIDRSGS